MDKEEFKARILTILSFENKDFDIDKILDRPSYFKNYKDEEKEYLRRNREYLKNGSI